MTEHHEQFDPDKYADEVTITFMQTTDNIGAEVVSAYEIVVQPGGLPIDLNEVRKSLREILLTDYTLAEDSVGTIRQARFENNWGSSGTVVHFVVQTAQDFTPEVVVALATSGVIALTKRLQTAGYRVTHGPLAELTDSQIVEHAMRTIAAEYNVAESDLTLMEMHASGKYEHSVVASGPTGSTYGVTFTVRRGKVAVSHRWQKFS